MRREQYGGRLAWIALLVLVAGASLSRILIVIHRGSSILRETYRRLVAGTVHNDFTASPISIADGIASTARSHPQHGKH